MAETYQGPREFRCPDCSAVFTGAESYAKDNTCPKCGLVFGSRRVKWDGKWLVALDPIKPGERVQIIPGSAALIIEPPKP